jgi:SAM-dependent methyltransferase
MKTGYPLKQAIIGWDTSTWGQAIDFWEQFLPPTLKGWQVLELGAGAGGLSLYFALQGAHVLCSDLTHPEVRAAPLHRRYGQECIQYQALDALALDLPDHSQDLVVFKSVMGGVGKQALHNPRMQMLGEILRVLKPGGWLCFAENLRGAPWNPWLRQHFVPWSQTWHYLSLPELQALMQSFPNWHYQTTGLTSLFGRNERNRQQLARLDHWLAPLTPATFHTCVMVVAQTPTQARVHS